MRVADQVLADADVTPAMHERVRRCQDLPWTNSSENLRRSRVQASQVLGVEDEWTWPASTPRCGGCSKDPESET